MISKRKLCGLPYLIIGCSMCMYIYIYIYMLPNPSCVMRYLKSKCPRHLHVWREEWMIALKDIKIQPNQDSTWCASQ